MLYIILTYLVLHILVFTTYVPPVAKSETVMLLAASQWIIPTLMLVLLVPRVNRLVNPLANIRFWTYVVLVAVAACIVMQITGTPGLWWAWSTMGLLILIVLLVARANVTTGYTTTMLLGVMVMLLAMSSWEVIYQTGLLFYHSFFGSGTINYGIVIAEQLMWVIPAMIVILVLYKRFGNTFIQLKLFGVTCIALSVLATVVWFVDGMEIPLLWWKGQGPFVNLDANLTMIKVSRASQGFWLLGVASMFTKDRK